MEKEENSKQPIPVDSDEDEHYELPPSYEEATQLPLTPSLGHKIVRAWHVNSGSRYWKQERPLQFLLPDPTSIRCCCGYRVDTTRSYHNLPPGTMKCSCGYIVNYKGYACHPSQYYHSPRTATTPRNSSSARKCSCGELLPEIGVGSKPVDCKCGATFYPDGTVQELCAYHKTLTPDARNILCKGCSRYLDTTAVWTILHGSKTSKTDNPRKGMSCYEYTLPEGTALCACGKFVRRDGSWSDGGGHVGCCSVLSCRPRLTFSEEGGRGRCTCVR